MLLVSCIVFSSLIAIGAIPAQTAMHSMGKRRKSDAVRAGISPHGTIDRHVERSEAQAESRGEDALEAAPSMGVAVQSAGTEKQVQSSEPEKANADDKKWSNIITGIINFIEIVIALVFAYLYKTKVVDLCPVMPAATPGSKGKEFKQGLFDCFSNMDICLHSCCCVCCRAAHTWHVTQLMDYWKGIGLFVCCWFCMPCVGGCYMRQKLRVHVGLEEDSCMDCVKYLFCEPCSVAQEALLVDEETGVQVQCCLNLTKGTTPLVANNEKAPSRMRASSNKAKASEGGDDAEVDF
jgi:Cys-rich protein (TIGR01571 family)